MIHISSPLCENVLPTDTRDEFWDMVRRQRDSQAESSFHRPGYQIRNSVADSSSSMIAPAGNLNSAVQLQKHRDSARQGAIKEFRRRFHCSTDSTLHLILIRGT